MGTLHRHPSFSALFIVLLSTPAAVAATDARALLDKMRDAMVPAKTLHADVELTMTTADGTRVGWSGDVYRRGGGDAAVRRFVFERPQDVAGVEIVLKQTEREADAVKVFLPALRRVREIRTDLQGEPFLGTDFNYEDLGFEEMDFRKHAIKGKDEVEGRSCTLVESVTEGPYGYGRVVRCIDDEDFLPRRTEYFDRSGTLWKVRTIERVKKIGEDPVPTRIVMKDVQTNTQSALDLRDVRLDPELPESAFRIIGLEKGEKTTQR